MQRQRLPVFLLSILHIDCRTAPANSMLFGNINGNAARFAAGGGSLLTSVSDADASWREQHISDPKRCGDGTLKTAMMHVICCLMRLSLLCIH